MLAEALSCASGDDSADVVELLVELGLDLHATRDGDGCVGGQALRAAAHRRLCQRLQKPLS